MYRFYNVIGAVVALHEEVSIVAADYCAISVVAYRSSPIYPIGITAYDAHIRRSMPGRYRMV